MNVIIFGTGQFGRALTSLALNNHHKVFSWSLREGKPLDTLPEGDVYISTLNASGVEQIGDGIRSIAQGKPIISATKAFVHAENLQDIFPSRILGDSTLVFAGPNLASEMLLGLPSGATIAGEMATFERVREIFETPSFFLEYSPNKRNVELMGIMKNIIAIGIGMIDGFALGENAKGIFIARMCRDVADFTMETYGDEFDITGLYAGIGDLFSTCSSTESRNHGFGLYFARSRSIQTATEFMNTSIEGLWSIGVLAPLFPPKHKFLRYFLSLFDDNGVNATRENFMKLFSL